MTARMARTPREGRSEYVVGLMSGTSADGIEAALLSLRGAPPDLAWKLRTHASFPLPRALRERILAAAGGAAWPAA